MTWILSKALVDSASWHCSPEPEAESSADICSDGGPSAPSKTTPIAAAYLCSGKTTGFSRLSRYGMTFAPLTDAHGEAVLMWFREVFRAKTSALPEAGQESTASEADCGSKWRGSLAKYDPDSRLWKTAQLSLVEGLDEFSETWPKWGTMRNGVFWERETLALPTPETEYGSWPTPAARDYAGANSEDHLRKERGHHDQLPNRVKMVELGMISDPAGSAGMSSITASSDSTDAPIVKERSWPTPTSRDHKGRSGNHSCLPKEVEREQGSGRLNPEWVEWLMGWPLGWTGLSPLGMDRFREWLQQHSLSFTGESQNE